MSRYDNPYGDSRYSSGDERRQRRTSQSGNLSSGSRYSRSQNDGYRVSSGNSQYLSRERQQASYGEHRQASYGERRQASSGQRQSAQRGDTARRRGSTYENMRSSEQSYRRQAAQSRDAAQYARAGEPSYSRYNAGARYSEAARKRSGKGVPSGMAGQRRYTEEGKKSRGFSLAHLGIRIPFVGTSSRGNAPRGSFQRGINMSAAKGPIIAIVSAAAILIFAIVLWSFREIEIEFNGETTKVRVGSTIEQIISETEFETTPGNLISVSGNKLEDGQGYAYLFKLNDEEQDGVATADYRASEGDVITLENGRDRTEDYDVQIVEEQPTLEMGGDAWGNISYISQWPTVGSYEMRTGKISGETARGDQVTETQNCIVSVHQITPDDGRKLVALTFDDGPAASYTESYLEIMNKYGVHATFFNLGQNLEEYPDLAKKIIEQGSEVMSHTYQHQELTTLDAESLQSELSNTFSDISSLLGVNTTCFRPPYGSFNESSWLNSGGKASVSVLWNLDSEDWRRAGADSIVSKSTSGVFNGAIILMHDGGGDRSQDVEALPRIIETLQAEGYEFVTVSELMKSDSSIPEDIANGNATMPEGCTWPTMTTSEAEKQVASTVNASTDAATTASAE